MMKKTVWKIYLFWIGTCEAVGLLSGLLIKNGVDRYQDRIRQPPFSPPAWVFPLVWGILFALMGISAARLSRAVPSAARKRSYTLFLLQLGFNFIWPLLFFNAQAFGLAFIWIALLWALILSMILSFRKTEPLAAALQLPYLLWVSFAAYLNYGVLLLNP